MKLPVVSSRTATRLLGVVAFLLLVVAWRVDQAVRTAYGSGWVLPGDAGRQLATGTCDGCLRLPSHVWIVVHALCGFLVALLALGTLLLWRARARRTRRGGDDLGGFLWVGAGIVVTLAFLGAAGRVAAGLGHAKWGLVAAAAADALVLALVGVMTLAVANVLREGVAPDGSSLLASARGFLQRQRINLIVVAGLATAMTLLPQSSGQAIDSVRTWAVFSGGAHGVARFSFGIASSLLLAYVLYEGGVRLAQARPSRVIERRYATWQLLLGLGLALVGLGTFAAAVLHAGYGLIVAGAIALVLAALEAPSLPERRTVERDTPPGDSGGHASEYIAIVPLLAVASVTIAAAVDAALSRGVTGSTFEVLLPGLVLAAAAVVATSDRAPERLPVPRLRAWVITSLAGLALAAVLLPIDSGGSDATDAVTGVVALLLAFAYGWLRFRPPRRAGLRPAALSLPLAFAAGLTTFVAVHGDVHSVAESLGTFALVNLSLAFILTLFHFAVVGTFSLRPPRLLCWFGLEQLPLVSLIVLWWVGAGAIGSPRTLHEVRLEPRVAAGNPGPSPTLAGAFAAWREAQPELRAGAPRSTEPIPLVLLASHGGGIRAAYWTAIALDCIVGSSPTDSRAVGPDTCRGERRAPEEQRLASGRLFLASGVSGGAVGIYAYARELLSGGSLGDGTWPDARLGRDFASATVGWGLFHDVPNHFVGLNSHRGGACGLKLGSLCLTRDRAAVLEDDFDRSWEGPAPLLRHTWELRSSPDAAVRRVAEAVPLIVTNATVTGGRARALVSAANLAAWPSFETDARFAPGERVDSYPLAGTVEAAETLCRGRDIRLSIAALLGARFPYVSPSGHLSGRCTRSAGDDVDPVDAGSPCATYDPAVCELRLVDGGYAENSGLFTIAAVWPSLRELVLQANAEAAAMGLPPIAPVIVELDNHYHVARQSPVTGRGVSGESLIPLSTALGARTAMETYARAVAYRLRPATCTVTVTPALHPGLTAPLGWELSDDAREDLRSGLVRAQDLPEDLTPQVLVGAAAKPYPRGEDGPLWRAFQLRRLQEWLGRAGEGLDACVPG